MVKTRPENWKYAIFEGRFLPSKDMYAKFSVFSEIPCRSRTFLVNVCLTKNWFFMAKIPNALLENLVFRPKNHSGRLFTMKDLFFVEHILTKKLAWAK
jgi:hypothetical protein